LISFLDEFDEELIFPYARSRIGSQYQVVLPEAEFESLRNIF